MQSLVAALNHGKNHVHVIVITVTVAVTEDIAITSIYNIKNGRQSHTVRVVGNVVLF